MRVGVLALQGAVREHISSFAVLGIEAVAIRLPEQLQSIAGLVIPGGESTAIGKLMKTYGFYEAVRQKCAGGLAVWGTCAGAILMAATIVDARPDQEPLGLMDSVVRRNAYGRQVNSFQAPLAINGWEEPFEGVFIRAPIIESVGDNVTALSRYDGQIVAAQEGNLLATTFHPELTQDVRMHEYFVQHVIGSH